MERLFTADPFILATALAGVLVLLLFLFLLRSRRRYQLLEEKYQERVKENDSLSTRIEELTERLDRDAVFAVDLNQAELVARLRDPAFRDYEPKSERSVPERYRYAKRLSDSGMNAGQIASCLGISPHEADQLVRLARIAHESNPPSLP